MPRHRPFRIRDDARPQAEVGPEADDGQWATSATASDSWNYAPKYATGAPDSYAWMSMNTSAWLETTFPGGRAKAVRVHEAGGAPLVMRIDLTDDQGLAHTVYSGGDQTANGGWLVVPVELTSYNVVKVEAGRRAGTSRWTRWGSTCSRWTRTSTTPSTS